MSLVHWIYISGCLIAFCILVKIGKRYIETLADLLWGLVYLLVPVALSWMFVIAYSFIKLTEYGKNIVIRKKKG